MTREGFEPKTSRLVAYVLPPLRHVENLLAMTGLSRLYETANHMVLISHSLIGCRVRNLGSYIHGCRVRNHYGQNIGKYRNLEKAMEIING